MEKNNRKSNKSYKPFNKGEGKNKRSFKKNDKNFGSSNNKGRKGDGAKSSENKSSRPFETKKSNNSRDGFKPRGKSRRYRGKNNKRKTSNKNVLSHSVFESNTREQKKEHIPENTFFDFGLDVTLLRNITDRGFTAPTPIQDQIIGSILKGKDVYGVAQTGSGKTAAFLIPLINKMLKKDSYRALIMVPTRELATQIKRELVKLTPDLEVNALVCIGGDNIGPQIRGLESDPQVVIGTPGRIIDLKTTPKLKKVNGKRPFYKKNKNKRSEPVENPVLDLSTFNHIVLDEVDRMLDMGFLDDVRDILSDLAQYRQGMFFSATTNSDAEKIAEEFLDDPVQVIIKDKFLSPTIARKIQYFKSPNDKMDHLHELLIGRSVQKALVFVNRRFEVDKITDELVDRGFRAAAIHGNKTQANRRKSINKFREDKVKILVATDVASRGLDIDDVTHVINYDIPQSYEDFVHRIGRTGRQGKRGEAITFLRESKKPEVASKKYSGNNSERGNRNRNYDRNRSHRKRR